MPTFNGFSDRVFDFYDELAVNNSKSFWAEHKTVYETEVRDPMHALVAELEPEFGETTRSSATGRRWTTSPPAPA